MAAKIQRKQLKQENINMKKENCQIRKRKKNIF
jgi:hypothetical protein